MADGQCDHFLRLVPGQLFFRSSLRSCIPAASRLPAWQVVGAALVLAAITAAAVVWRRTFPYLLVGWLWYLGMLVPVIGLLQIGPGRGRPLHLPAADRAFDRAGLDGGGVVCSRKKGQAPFAGTAPGAAHKRCRSPFPAPRLPRAC